MVADLERKLDSPGAMSSEICGWIPKSPPSILSRARANRTTGAR
jgi:hypothetical protein